MTMHESMSGPWDVGGPVKLGLLTGLHLYGSEGIIW